MSRPKQIATKQAIILNRKTGQPQQVTIRVIAPAHALGTHSFNTYVVPCSNSSHMRVRKDKQSYLKPEYWRDDSQRPRHEVEAERDRHERMKS